MATRNIKGATLRLGDFVLSLLTDDGYRNGTVKSIVVLSYTPGMGRLYDVSIANRAGSHHATVWDADTLKVERD